MENINTGTPVNSESCFVLTLPSRDEPWQHDKLDRVFDSGHKIKTAFIADRKKALEELRRTKAWRETQNQIASINETFKKQHPSPKKEKVSDPDGYAAASEDKKRCLAVLYEQRNAMLKTAGFTKNDFEKRILKFSSHYKRKVKGQNRMVGLIPAPAVQKIANDVWDEFKVFIYGKGKNIRFPKWSDFTCIRGKSNTTGIVFNVSPDRYWESELLFNGMRIPVTTSPPWEDDYGYEEEALKRNIKFVSIMRRWYEDGWRYFVQLTLSGEPPVKVNKYTGEVLHPLGKGRVGLDIGTQTLAVSSSSEAMLVELADRVKDIDRELKKINRAMDRSRRAMNPKMYQPDGQIVPINKLPPECLSRHNSRRWWNKSKHHKELESRRRALYREQGECKTLQHNSLANILLTLGDEFYIENMDFAALAKRSKETKKNVNGKFISKKRFGKSLANKAPAQFVTILGNKLGRAGGSLTKINTWKAKASQFNHKTSSYTKKKLSKRWNDIDGHKVQRDLYSAFLIMNTNDTLDGFIKELCDKTYENFLKLHDKEVNRLQLDFKKYPSSMGITPQTVKHNIIYLR